ncbi:thioredoxin family protein [Terrimonas pollutisoli]|uniref:thioredoxin family protein n=1 Tax=Terrimonas pollutisoli TaxID=3034147 RepID=UPI0023EDEC1F|nr:thioredoxin family protein [Terrimonas sp. H1YJ31]
MKKIIILWIAVFFTGVSFSQDMKSFKLYKPEENAEKKIADAVKQAKAEGKNVFVQIGGNWCIWCALFNDIATTDKSIDSVIKANYVVYHLNYSKENRNEKLLAKYAFPQRFGFPVFLILNGKGELIHTQNSVYLEEGKGYNTKTVIGFLNDWSSKALDPKQYKEQ